MWNLWSTRSWGGVFAQVGIPNQARAQSDLEKNNLGELKGSYLFSETVLSIGDTLFAVGQVKNVSGRPVLTSSGAERGPAILTNLSRASYLQSLRRQAWSFFAGVVLNGLVINLPLAAQVFDCDDLLAFALAHEKGHISNGDLSWEPRGTELLWNVMTEAFQRAEQNGDTKSAAALDAGIVSLQRSFEANAQLNEIEADLAAVSMVEAAGFDRKAGLAFLLNTVGDTHHPPGVQRVQAIRRHLENSERAISDQEMAEIQEMARTPNHPD